MNAEGRRGAQGRSFWKTEALPADRDRGDEVPAALNELSARVMGCAMQVHSTLGSGLSERLYEDAMVYELRAAGAPFVRQAEFVCRYKDTTLTPCRIDLVAGDQLIVEFKAAQAVADAHLAQLLNYLRVTGRTLGLMINFSVPRLIDGVYRRATTMSRRPLSRL